MISISDIRLSYSNFSGFVYRTPLIYSGALSRMTGAEVYLKAENLQKTGSFKVRGAFSKLMKVTEAEVITASMGNHAQGVAYAASRLGKKAVVVMPQTAPITKEEATRGYGAEVILYGETLQDALDFARSYRNHCFVHPFDDELVIAGQGSIGLEIVDDLKEADAVIVPVGGGGLIAGVAAAIKSLSPDIGVFGVQTVSVTSAYSSLREKKIIPSVPSVTIADGISVGRVGDKPFEIISSLVDDICLVKEETVAFAILTLMERKKLVTEGAGALALAMLLENKERFQGKKVVLVLSGGNIDSTLVDRIIHRGLIAGHRIGIFEVIVSDRPGSLHSVTGIIASCRGNILHVSHQRTAKDLLIGETKVMFTVETRNEKHLADIISRIAADGYPAKEI